MRGRTKTPRLDSISKTPFWKQLQDPKDFRFVRKHHRVTVQWHDDTFRKGIVTCVPPESKNIIVELDGGIGEIAISDKQRTSLQVYIDPVVEEEFKKLKEANDPKLKERKYDFFAPSVAEHLKVSKSDEKKDFDPNDW